MRSQVRRWALSELEQVRHQRLGQEWVPHWHAEWSIGAVVHGTCECSVAGQRLAPTTGDLLAIAPGTVHTGALLSPAGQAAVLVVMLYVPTPWFESRGLAPPPCSGRLQAPELAAAAQQLDSQAAVERWLHQALPALGQGLERLDGGAPMQPRAQRLLLTLQAEVIQGQHSVGALAAACGISRERLHRVVKRWTGMAPADYLRAVRVNRAREMLLAGESPADVAAACGFADQAHFTRWYRKVFGYTPGDLLNA